MSYHYHKTLQSAIRPVLIIASVWYAGLAAAQVRSSYDSIFTGNLKKEALVAVAAKEKNVQEMVDMIFKFWRTGLSGI